MNAKEQAILTSLHPELRARIDRVLSAMGGRMSPFCGVRSAKEQADLFAQGRKVVWGKDFEVVSHVIINKELVRTNAKPWSSAHNWTPSRAVDCVLNTQIVKANPRKGYTVPDLWDTTAPEAAATWKDYARLVKAEGLVWGGDFKSKSGKPLVDMPHAELPDFRDEKWNVT